MPRPADHPLHIHAGVANPEVIRQTTIARNFLTTALGLHHSQSVHIVPRHPEAYDAVVNTSNPRAVAKFLSQQVIVILFMPFTPYAHCFLHDFDFGLVITLICV